MTTNVRLEVARDGSLPCSKFLALVNNLPSQPTPTLRLTLQIGQSNPAPTPQRCLESLSRLHPRLLLHQHLLRHPSLHQHHRHPILLPPLHLLYLAQACTPSPLTLSSLHSREMGNPNQCFLDLVSWRCGRVLALSEKPCGLGR